ncbi:MAG: hypothetical protein R2867_11885 [Caldilineaceae bacterium]
MNLQPMPGDFGQASYSLRPLTANDEPFLWQMLYYAAHMHEEVGKSVADAMQIRHWRCT